MSATITSSEKGQDALQSNASEYSSGRSRVETTGNSRSLRNKPRRDYKEMNSGASFHVPKHKKPKRYCLTRIKKLTGWPLGDHV